mmetsp:Transcript_30487/g.62162  ORF Transcript_30487/g.62162 Transcript_30487/m.62162 type:complete len:92 (+) Transcript_30487:193-468(+)
MSLSVGGATLSARKCLHAPTQAISGSPLRNACLFLAPDPSSFSIAVSGHPSFPPSLPLPFLPHNAVNKPGNFFKLPSFPRNFAVPNTSLTL